MSYQKKEITNAIKHLQKEKSKLKQNAKSVNEYFKSINLVRDLLNKRLEEESFKVAYDIQRLAADKVEFFDAKDILLEEVQKALQKNKEYNIAIFSEPLIETILINPIVNVSPVSDTAAYVEINLDTYAGTLQDWGKAVLKVRKKLKVKEKSDPIRASIYWRDFIYNNDDTSLYLETIKDRLGANEKKAPFWELLDKGNVPLVSDRGGFPYPRNEPTNFVLNTKKRLQSLYKKYVKKYKKEHEDILKIINDALENINKLEAEVRQSTLYVKTLEEFNKKLELLTKTYKGTASPQRIYETAEKLLTDVKLRERVELTARGSASRVHPRYSRLLKLLGE